MRESGHGESSRDNAASQTLSKCASSRVGLGVGAKVKCVEDGHESDAAMVFIACPQALPRVPTLEYFRIPVYVGTYL